VLATGEEAIGSKLSGLYEIESVLGRGGTSIIYRARHQLMDRVVAIKMLLWSGDALHDEKKIRRFQQEARMSSRLNHPNIATLFDFGVSPQGQPYLVMEFLEGASLEAIVKKTGPMEVTRAVKIFLKICDAIEHAHQKGVIHRDLKPSNVLVTTTPDGEDHVKVVDFGLAEMLPNAGQDASMMKITGPAFGSPLYMAPEQCLNKPIDSRCDIYAMGVLMFQVLCGRLPFIGDTLVEVMTKHISAPAPKLSSVLANASFPDVLETAVQQCLRKVPAQRQQSMAKLKEQLQPLIQGGERETLLQQITLIIADDNLVISEGIKHLLYKFEDVRVIATAANGKEAAELVDQLRPDIVLMDFEMPEMDGLEATQLIKASVPNTRIIMMSSHESEHDIINCFRAGAEGFMLKKFDSNTLPLAIRNVVQGATWLDPSVSSNVLEIYRRSAPEIMERAAARPPVQVRKDAPDDIAFVLKLAESFAQEEKYDEAQSLYRLALAVLEKIKGATSPEIMNVTLCLADAYFSQNKLQQAEPLFFRSLELQVELLGPGHQNIAFTLEKIGEMYARQDNYPQAEQYFFGAYNIRDRAEMPDHMAIAAICAKLAEVYTKQEKLGQADHYIQLARRERAKTRRSEH
jgi:serine/threonine protein kinase